MTAEPIRSRSHRVLVTDFDGTMTRIDFYQLVRARLLPPETPDYWMDYRAGRMTHFEALRRFFHDAEGGEESLVALTHEMELQPDLGRWLDLLRAAGWDTVVVSAGCGWYIERLLAEAGVTLEVHASPGRIVHDRLVMELPDDSPFKSISTGIDKAAVVRSFQSEGRTCAFAGDGFPDLESALLVAPELRFARGDLAQALQEQTAPFRSFTRWSDVVEALLAGDQS